PCGHGSGPRAASGTSQRTARRADVPRTDLFGPVFLDEPEVDRTDELRLGPRERTPGGDGTQRPCRYGKVTLDHAQRTPRPRVGHHGDPLRADGGRPVLYEYLGVQQRLAARRRGRVQG